jgi:hypothetical protein
VEPAERSFGRLRALGPGLFIVLLSLGVYLHGWWVTPAGFVFTGIHPHNDHDQFPQYMFMEQARQGRLALANLFTSEQTQVWPVVRPLFMLLGWLCRLTDWPLWVGFHLGRALLILGCVLVIRSLACATLPRSAVAVALWLVLTSSGIGWIRKEYPTWHSTDHIVKESITFMHFHDSPHFVLSLLLILGTVVAFLRQRSSRRWILVGGAALFLLGLEHPYDVVTLLAVLLVEALVRFWHGERSDLAAVVAMFALGTPAFLYVLIAYRIDPVLAGWRTNNVMLSTSALSLLSGFGLLVPLAMSGARYGFREQLPATGFLVRWCVVQALLCYAPVDFQRRLVFGLHVPLCLLACLGIRALLPARRVLVIPVVLLLSLSNIRYLVFDWESMGARGLPYSVPVDLWKTMDAIRASDVSATTVLADREWSAAVAAFTGRRVFWGDRYLEVIGPPEVLLEKAMATGSREAWLEFLRAARISHLLEQEGHSGPLQQSWTRAGLAEGMAVVTAGPTARLLRVTPAHRGPEPGK